MSTVLLQKTKYGALAPADEIAKEALRSIEIGGIVKCEVRRPRNLQHHRKFFALINLIFQNQSRYKDPDDMLDDIKVYVGHCVKHTMRDGTVVMRPKSIAFDKLDQAGFEKFYDSVIDVVVKEIIPGLNENDLRRELQEFAEVGF